MSALFGYTGFVGSHLLEQYGPFDYLYNSKNIDEARDHVFGTVFISCVPAVKWKANKYPQDLSLIHI